MKQFMGFKASATAVPFGTNAAPTAIGATSPEMLGTAIPGLYAKANGTGKLIAIDAAAKFLDVKSFVIARGNAKGSNPLDTDDTKEGATLSDEIDRKTLTVEKYPHTVGVAKVITLGGAANGLIGGVVAPANATAGVTIVDTAPTIMTDWKTRTYEVKPALGATGPAVATALAAKIMADPNRLADAAGSGETLVLTHRTKGKTFDAHGTDLTICENCAKVVTTQPVREDNSIAGVRELELECAGYQGQTRRGDGQLGDILPYTQVEIDDPNGVIMYHLTWERSVNRQGTPVDNKASRFLRLYLSVPSGNTAMIAALDALLSAAVQEETPAQADETPLLAKREEAQEQEAERVKEEAKKEKARREKEEEEAREKREKEEPTTREKEEEAKREREAAQRERQQRPEPKHMDVQKGRRDS